MKETIAALAFCALHMVVPALPLLVPVFTDTPAHVQLVVAPRLPQAAQMKPASMSERRTPSAQQSPPIAIEWLQR